jgi:serine/threonine-protein phosphatase 5
LKGFYRRGSANIALSHFKEAKQDFLYVCKQKPTDRDARAKLAECEKQIKRILFEEAIAFEHERSAFAKIDPESIGASPTALASEFVRANFT